MTSVGLVGGLGPESTIDYYRRILGAWQAERPGTAPSIVIDSLDVRYGLRYMNELLVGDFRDQTRAGVVDIVRRMRRDAGVEGVIFGGTELPLLLRDSTIAGVPTLDTTALHVAAIVTRLLD